MFLINRLSIDFPTNYYSYTLFEGGTSSYMNRVDLFYTYLWYSLIIITLIIDWTRDRLKNEDNTFYYNYNTFLLNNKYFKLSSITIGRSKTLYNNIYLLWHNELEIVYTLLPCVLLILIYIPSVNLIYKEDNEGYISTYLNIIGYQWYWVYNIINYDRFNDEIITYNISNEDIKLENYLELDNILILPINNNIQILLTSNDVIHSFSIYSLGLKVDCIPGRINSTILTTLKRGYYIGYCSELCGSYHNNMNICLKMCNFEDYLLNLFF